MLAYARGRGRRPRPAAPSCSTQHPELVRHARDERQRPVRDGGRPRARRAAARARRRRQPRQRLRLDEAPPGRLRQRPDARGLVLAAAARTDLSARGDGGTPLVAALFWGHREVVDLLGLEPRNLRVAAGLGGLDLIDELGGHARRGRAPRLLPPARRLPGVAAVRRSAGDPRRGARLGGEGRPRRGDRPARRARRPGRRGSVSRHAARLGGGERAVGGDPPAGRARRRPERSRHVRRADHGEGVPPLHLAAQSGQEEAVELLLELGADPTIRDAIHDGTPAGWAAHGCRPDLADRLE